MSSSASAQRTYKGQHAPVKDPAIVSFQRSTSMVSSAQSQISVSSPAQAGYPPEHRALRGRGLMTRGKPATYQMSSMSSPQQAMMAPPMFVDIPISVALRNNSSSSSSNNNARSSLHRERGVIEKMLHSYGFIQCTERECRLFFHFSELTPDDTFSFSVGDPVEFHQGVDRRTNKPVAVNIVRLPSLDMSCEVISEKSVVGKVLVPAKPPSIINLQGGEMIGGGDDGVGRVTYEQSGETFFLTYTVDDVETDDDPLSSISGAPPQHDVVIVAGDQVEFYISTDERNGNLKARRVHRIGGGGIGVGGGSVGVGIGSGSVGVGVCVTGGGGVVTNPAEVYTGVVCSLKDNYGFIERADVVKELFFHFSEFQGATEELQMGDDVSFNIQTRNCKEVGVNIHLLPSGTVIFEDVAPEKKRGKIQKLLKPVARTPVDPLSGRIVYETLKGPIEIAYGERDQVSEFTIQLGDIVEFYIATDRRDQLKRATNINLVDVTFTISGEKREQGFIAALKDGFGFIRCVDREGRMFFNFGEVLNQSRAPKLQDEVEFTVLPDQTNVARLLATRVRYLAKGTINEEECVSPIRYVGVVAKAAALSAVHQQPQQQQQANIGSPNRLSASVSLAADPDPGIILYDVDGTKQTIPYSVHHSVTSGQSLPKQADQVEFHISESLRNNTKTAVMVRVVLPAAVESITPTSSHSKVALKCASGSSNGTSGSTSSSAGGSNSSTSGSVVMRSSQQKDREGIRAKRMSSGASIGSTSHSSSDTQSKSSRHSAAAATTSNGSGGRSRKSNGLQRQEVGETEGGVQTSVSGSVMSQSDTSVGASRSVSNSTQSSAVTGNESSLSVDSDSNGNTARELGFVATLKDSFGFIEMADRDKEVFFHYSNYEGDAAELDVGDEVEFTFAEKTGRISAARVRRRTRGTIIPEEILSGMYEGEVVRGLRITNPEQGQYCGLIQLCDTLSGSVPIKSSVDGGGVGRVGLGDGEGPPVYTYGVMSLVDRRDLPQKGDQVRFQLSVMRASSSSSSSSSCGDVVNSSVSQGGVLAELGYRATRVLPVRKLVHAKVDSIKGQTGILSYETDEGKRLTFPLAEASTSLEGSDINPGDDVEFAPVRRPHGGKMVASCVRKIGERPRPERLSRLKSVVAADEGPRLIALRQPRGPDGSKGFKLDHRPVTSSSSSPQLTTTLLDHPAAAIGSGSGSIL